MAYLPEELRTRGAGRYLLVGSLLLIFSATGCVTTGVHDLLGHHEKPADEICQVVVTWKNYVHFTPDPTKGGAPTPGIAGRMYLFGTSIDRPRVGDGGVVVDLYDETPLASGGQAIMLEQWRIDPVTLSKLRRRDPIGEGYTLFLPWATYRPEIKQVRMNLRYEPNGGIPLYATPGSLTLNGEETMMPTPHGPAAALGKAVPSTQPQTVGTQHSPGSAQPSVAGAAANGNAARVSQPIGTPLTAPANRPLIGPTLTPPTVQAPAGR